VAHLDPRRGLPRPRHKGRLEEALRGLLKGADVLHIHSLHAVLTVWAGLKVRELGFKGKLVAFTQYHGISYTFSGGFLGSAEIHCRKTLEERRCCRNGFRA